MPILSQSCLDVKLVMSVTLVSLISILITWPASEKFVGSQLKHWPNFHVFATVFNMVNARFSADLNDFNLFEQQ